MFYEVAPVERFRAGGAVLTYRSTEKLKRGQVAEVPFGKKTVTGVVMEEVKQPKFETKPVVRVISEKVLPGHLLKAAEFVHKYYVTEMPVVWQAVLPPSLLSLPASENLVFRTPTPKTSANLPTVDQSSLPLNTSQETAVKAIKDNPSKTVLLHGVTGSGKTNIYIKLIAEVLAEGKSAILLVPEIALSAQLIRAVREYFPDATLLHSQQTPKTRRELWLKTLEAEGPQVVVGPRSALFAPVRELGLVIIDEAHEPAYHQDKMPKYSALRVASAVSPKTVLGTATPTIVDYSLASSRDAVVKLSEKAKAVSPAEVSVVDLRERSNLTRNRFFSRTLMDAIAENLGKGEQSLIYHNRRGSAAITMCEECGWQSVCSECLLPMTLHLDKKKLLCHACGKAEKQPLSCPECGTAGLLHKGIGTKILEAELVKLFPQARVARFDGDNKKNETMAARYAEVAAGEVNILVGTQTLAKGFDLPKLTLVGVVQADQGLVLPDFAAEERCFQLLSQVVGRVGRHEGKSRVVVQTYQPEAPAVVYGVEADYEGFFARSLELRRKAKLPPYVYLMKLARVAKTETTALRACQKLRRELVAAVGGS
ncbi:primosomal protein N', partial [Candidatus Saccharibacteria bacterium]|nr:primosomal protein N' [Candidatus Saccharibacteria bacterium]